jgi:hypothetical protein
MNFPIYVARMLVYACYQKFIYVINIILKVVSMLKHHVME